ncbi:MAG TPA: histidine phosphatase family protein [Steroidobacteraceae bacterium]|nr:histidine phosphatase family protein [Steroidobacteraceae bacterium]
MYLIRHLQPIGGRGICYGSRDLCCDHNSLPRAAAALRTRLPPRALREFPLFTSPLSRCRALAQELAAPREPCVAEELREIDFGAWEGTAWDDLPRAELDAWARDVWHYRPGGGESAAMLEERWRRWCATLDARMSDAVIAVTHAGVIRAALAASGRLRREEAASTRIAFGSLHVVEPPAGSMRLQGAGSCATL